MIIFSTQHIMAQSFNTAEKKLILSGDTTKMLKVTQVSDPGELKILTTASSNINPEDPLIPVLARRMQLAMLADPKRPGVGIAAPQVGINRNIIWVQRFDKEGLPFELFLNPQITWKSALLRKGREGCLSIADTVGQVVRHHTIRLIYTTINGAHKEEIIEGFTAVILQHETDHLHGILFPVRLKEQDAKSYHSLTEKLDFMVEKLEPRL
ncbi:peptide deformylase [Pedobacter lusitanus]|uniref:Peptide deformylase n=1 Tax=Pedobacter lusitanus TaxID=1503925 RepID=A0A0D0G2C7_9SPHI|nr:peptide deformylase [Pedobacter lusitanus]